MSNVELIKKLIKNSEDIMILVKDITQILNLKKEETINEIMKVIDSYLSRKLLEMLEKEKKDL